MTWITDSQQLYAGKWITTAYVGRGIKGAAVVNNGTDGGSIIGQATTVDPAKEYRMQIVSLPPGFTLSENGSGSSTSVGVAVLKLFEDGVEL